MIYAFQHHDVGAFSIREYFFSIKHTITLYLIACFPSFQMCTALFQPFIILTESHSGKDVARNQQPGKLPTKRGPGAATRPGSIRYGGQPDEALHIQSDWPDWNK